MRAVSNECFFDFDLDPFYSICECCFLFVALGSNAQRKSGGIFSSFLVSSLLRLLFLLYSMIQCLCCIVYVLLESCQPLSVIVFSSVIFSSRHVICCLYLVNFSRCNDVLYFSSVKMIIKVCFMRLFLF